MKKNLLIVLFPFFILGCDIGIDFAPYNPTPPEKAKPPTPPVQPESFNLQAIQAAATKTKTFRLTWEESQGASSYQVCLKNTSQPDNCDAIHPPVSATRAEIALDHALLSNKLDFFIIASNAVGKTFSNIKAPDHTATVAAIGYIKNSYTHEDDYFGYSIALSDDGNTLAVSSPQESFYARGINDPIRNTDIDQPYSGAVYIFTRRDKVWTQQAYIKASNPTGLGTFGNSISLSEDGNILAVGSPGEASNTTNVNAEQYFSTFEHIALNPHIRSYEPSGAVYVFTRTEDTWSQQTFIKASNAEGNDTFGSSVSLSNDGSTLAVGAPFESSSATGIDGDQANNDAYSSGAVYVFTRNTGTWSQQAYIKASNTNEDDQFGTSVSLSSNGNTLAVGVPFESSSATGINGDQANNDAYSSGAVYVLTRNAGTWSQQAYIKASNTYEDDQFGTSVSLSSNGNTLAVGAPFESSSATGIDGDQANNDAYSSGAVYVFTRNTGTWSQQAYIKTSNTYENEQFGTSVSLSSNGNTLAVGAPLDSSSATGIDGDQANNDAFQSGAVYVFTRNTGTWSQQAYIKASNTDEGDLFGTSVSLSSNSYTLAIGAIGESSNATESSGDQANNDAFQSGAVYVY